MKTYGIDLADLLANPGTFESEVKALPEVLQNAKYLTALMNVEFKRIQKLYKILSQLNDLSNIDLCHGVNLDMYASDYGISRGNYTDDNDFRAFIKFWISNSRLNGGTIPEIIKAKNVIFPKDKNQIYVFDNRDGTVTLELPTSVYSPVLSIAAANLTAAGIELIIKLRTLFQLGFQFNQTQEIVKDRDDNVIKLRKNVPLSAGKRFRHYGARISLGMEVK